MKHLKRFNEGIHYDDIIEGTYTINEDGSIDVIGNVDLTSYELSEIPYVFNTVSGCFHCSENNLTTLKNCPKKVGWGFKCDGNNLKTLEHAPVTVGSYFNTSRNFLTTLEGCPSDIGGTLYINDNKEIYNFYGIGTIGDMFCRDTAVCEIFKLCPGYGDIHRDGSEESIKFIKYLNEFRPIRGKTILGKRLEECLYMCDIELDVTKLQFKNYTLLE